MARVLDTYTGQKRTPMRLSRNYWNSRNALHPADITWKGNYVIRNMGILNYFIDVSINI